MRDHRPQNPPELQDTTGLFLGDQILDGNSYHQAETDIMPVRRYNEGMDESGGAIEATDGESQDELSLLNHTDEMSEKHSQMRQKQIPTMQ